MSDLVGEWPNKSARDELPDFMPQLEALRFFAILGVVYTHYLPESMWLFGIYWGGIGVKFFFVLTGFLLMRNIQAHRAQGSYERAWGRIVLRRSLRLFPPLLTVLAIAFVVGIEEVRDSLLWHLSFLSNIYFILKNAWHGEVSHLWYIAADQQTKLLIPWLLIFLPVSWTPAILFSLAGSAIAFRLVWRLSGLPDMGVWVLPFGYLDCFAAGALLAVFWRGAWRYMPEIAFVGMGLFILSRIPIQNLHVLFYHEMASLGPALLFVAIVAGAAKGYSGMTGYILNARSLVYLGELSYGIYLVHPFMPRLIRWAVDRSLWETSLLALIASIVGASAMYHLIERPLARVTRRLSHPRLEVIVKT